MVRRAVLGACGILISLILTQCLFIPDDEEHGEPKPNRRPMVRITGGVFSSDTAGVNYRVEFRWHGWDEDGVVAAYEWAVDDTTLEGAWHSTTAFMRQFSFRATTFDPADSSFYDWHRFFIRAIDNEFARSPIASRFFNARTIAPETEITFPVMQEGQLRLRRPNTFNVTWEGEDLDSSKPDRTPDFYEYKLVRFDLQEDPVRALIEKDNVFLDTLQVGDKTVWIRVPSDVTALRLEELPLAELFVFGVRAIDEAGAVEPSLDEAKNYFKFEVTGEECQPIVTMSETRLGEHVFPGDGEIWDVEVPSNTLLRFRWTGDATDCGSRPGNVNYALDIEDPDDETDRAPNGIGGWIGWGLWDEVQTPFSFPDRDDGKTHNFYVKMMDISNKPQSARFCWVRIKVIAFPLNRTALIIDDATVRPTFYSGGDPAHDALRERLMSCIYSYTEPGEVVETINLFGDNDTNFNPFKIPLEAVARYKLIIWNSFFFGTLKAGLDVNERERKILTTYVGAGGRLYLYGSKTIGSLAGGNLNYGGDGLCPELPGVDEPAWDDEDFIWKFLHLTNCVRSASGTTQQSEGWTGARSMHPLYPDLDLDPAIWDPWRPRNDGQPVGGTIWYEAYRRARTLPVRPEPGLDTLYVARTFDYGLPSQLKGHPCVLRYESTPEDSARGLEHGRVFLQMFSAFQVYEGPMTETACKAITWLMTGRDE